MDETVLETAGDQGADGDEKAEREECVDEQEGVGTLGIKQEGN